MEMNIKRTFSITLVCIILVTIFSAVLVYAPPPDGGVTPFQEVIVTNADPIPVEVTNETLAVTLDEPIDVTLDELIEVTNPSGESLAVTLDEPIEVVNTQKFEPFQVSIWGTLDPNDTEFPFGIDVDSEKTLVLEYLSVDVWSPYNEPGLANAEISVFVIGRWKGNPIGIDFGNLEPYHCTILAKGQYLFKEFKMYIDEFVNKPTVHVSYNLENSQSVAIRITLVGYFIDTQ